MKIETLDAFTRAYITAALWSSHDDADEPLDKNYIPEDIAPESLESIAADCAAFQSRNAGLLREAYAHPAYAAIHSRYQHECEDGSIAALAGHDFWLTRNGHGAGFWDRGLGALGDSLTAAADEFHTSDLYVGDDGKLYVSPISTPADIKSPLSV